MPSPYADHPLTDAQQGMWFLERLSRAAVYVDPLTFRLTGRLDVLALRRAIEDLCRRHAALRTTFPLVDGRPVQRVSEQVEVPVREADLSAHDDAEREAELAALLQGDTRGRFDLAEGPLVRVLLVRLGADEHVLRMTVHHMVTDAWSWWGVLLRELETLYAAGLDGRDAALPPPPAQLPDLVHWQHTWCEGPGYARQLTYWKRTLAGLEPLPQLDVARPGPATGRRSTATVWATVPRDVSAALDEVCTHARVTPFMLLLAAFQLVLHRHTGAEDIAVGTRAAVRSRPEFEKAVGFFVNLLVLRIELRRDDTFRQLLHTVRASALGAYAHREIPFEKLVEEIRPPRRGRFHSLVNVLFSFQSTPELPPRLPGLDSRLLNHDPQTLYDLDLVFFEEDGDLRALLTYDSSRYAAQAAAGLLDEVCDVLRAVAADPEVPLSTLLAVTTKAMPHAG
ncbi:condensation domain-containing protein [Streptomyces sp. NPDC007070]|uniref:condensation domain-containing protein n=1 Tax=Streptomyces sp. NPDC007070 TaxID=3154312 RepID=UPI0033DA88C2